MAARYKSVETKYVEARDRTLRALRGLDRRTFFKVSAASAGAAFAKGLVPPHSFQLVEVASAAVDKNWGTDRNARQAALHFRFVRRALKAVEDVNALDPQPDFVLFGGDLAQLGRKDEMRLDAEILKEVEAPIKIMVGDHDWFLDMGETWQDLFGPPNYSFDWKGATSSH
jgi:3',5'-cyclic-AMP phosphodiesterase